MMAFSCTTMCLLLSGSVLISTVTITMVRAKTADKKTGLSRWDVSPFFLFIRMAPGHMYALLRTKGMDQTKLTPTRRLETRTASSGSYNRNRNGPLKGGCTTSSVDIAGPEGGREI